MCSLDIPCRIGGPDDNITPANLCMPAQITRRAGVAGVQKPSDVSGLAAAARRNALEDMCLPALNILDTRVRFEEDIYGCIPLLRHAICCHISKLTAHERGRTPNILSSVMSSSSSGSSSLSDLSLTVVSTSVSLGVPEQQDASLPSSRLRLVRVGAG